MTNPIGDLDDLKPLVIEKEIHNFHNEIVRLKTLKIHDTTNIHQAEEKKVEDEEYDEEYDSETPTERKHEEHEETKEKTKKHEKKEKKDKKEKLDKDGKKI